MGTGGDPLVAIFAHIRGRPGAGRRHGLAAGADRRPRSAGDRARARRPGDRIGAILCWACRIWHNFIGCSCGNEISTQPAVHRFNTTTEEIPLEGCAGSPQEGITGNGRERSSGARPFGRSAFMHSLLLQRLRSRRRHEKLRQAQFRREVFPDAPFSFEVMRNIGGNLEITGERKRRL